MNTSILTWDTIDTSEIFSTFAKTKQIKPHSFMRYFNNALNKILMSWKFLATRACTGHRLVLFYMYSKHCQGTDAHITELVGNDKIPQYASATLRFRRTSPFQQSVTRTLLSMVQGLTRREWGHTPLLDRSSVLFSICSYFVVKMQKFQKFLGSLHSPTLFINIFPV